MINRVVVQVEVEAGQSGREETPLREHDTPGAQPRPYGTRFPFFWAHSSSWESRRDAATSRARTPTHRTLSSGASLTRMDRLCG